MKHLTILLGIFTITATAVGQPVLFVAPISNNTGQGQYNEVATAMTDMIMVLLAENKQAKVVERERLNDVLREQKLSLAGLADKDTLIRVGRLLKADRIISGGIILTSEDKSKKELLLATLHSWHTADGRLIGSVKASTEPEKLLELGLDLTAQVAKQLNIKLTPVDPAQLDKNPLASLHYMRGLGYFHAGNYDRAIMEFFLTTGLDPMHDRSAFWRALSYVELEEYDHAVIELEEFLKVQHDSPLVPRAKELLEKYRPMWAGHIPTLRAKEKAQKERDLFLEKPVFAPTERQEIPVLLLLPTKDFVKRYDAEPFAKLIEERIGVKVILLKADEAPEIGPLEGHKLISQGESLLQRLQKKHPQAQRLLILTEAALETDMDDRVISEHWPEAAIPKVMVASCLWLHMSPAPDLRMVNPLAPPLPEHPEFYNFVLGCAAQLYGAGNCPTFGCPANQEWYLWDQRYYKSWLCKYCRTAMRKAKTLE